jgi:hypothetical protein
MSGNFESISVALPVMNETTVLLETVDAILNHSAEDIREIIFVLNPKTTPECRALCYCLKQEDPERFVIQLQVRPFLGGAIRDALDRARGTHLALLSPHWETDSASLPSLISRARENPEAIICGRPEHWVLRDRCMQAALTGLYGTSLPDVSYGFRIFPVRLVNQVQWGEVKATFLVESILKPARLGIAILAVNLPEKKTAPPLMGRREIWSAFWLGVRTRFQSTEKFLKPALLPS